MIVLDDVVLRHDLDPGSVIAVQCGRLRRQHPSLAGRDQSPLSTGLRREELVNLYLSQLSPNSVDALRQARLGQINGVVGKGKTQRDVFLSLDARRALADYLENEHADDVTMERDEETPLFLVAIEAEPRCADGRLSPRSVNHILEKIGKWHDAGVKDAARHISPLRPHDLRHTFAFQLAKVTGADGYELERRLGHQSQCYILRYTNPPEDVAASLYRGVLE